MPFVHYDRQVKSAALRLHMLQGMELDSIRHQLGLPTLHQRSLNRWCQLFNETQAVIRDPATYEQRGRNIVFSDTQRDFVMELIKSDPSIYLDELAEQFYRQTGIFPPISTLSDLVNQRLNMTLKLAKRVHANRCDIQRAEFVLRIAQYPSTFLVFADETAIQERFCDRIRTRSERGQRSQRTIRSMKSRRFTCLPFVSLAGVLCCLVVEGSVKRTLFLDFLECEVLPRMNQYPGPDSVLVLDNASIHHSPEIRAAVAARGCRLEYNSPYSPDHCPEEKAFSCLKARLIRDQSLVGVETLEEAIDIIQAKVREVMTPTLMRSLWRGCGYLV